MNYTSLLTNLKSNEAKLKTSRLSITVNGVKTSYDTLRAFGLAVLELDVNKEYAYAGGLGHIKQIEKREVSQETIAVTNWIYKNNNRVSQ